MACRQRHDLLASAVEKRIGRHDERAGMQLDEGRQSRVDLVFRAGLQDGEPPPVRARRFLHVAYDALRKSNWSGSQAGRSPGPGEPARTAVGAAWVSARGAKMLKPVRLPPGRARLATRPAATRSPPPKKTIGIVEVASFAAAVPRQPPLATITSTLRLTRSAANAGSRS